MPNQRGFTAPVTAMTGRIRRADRRKLWVCGWLLAGGWAAMFPLVSTVGTHRSWGVFAAAGYAGAALAACRLPRPRARTAALASAVLGAVVLPFLYLVLTGRAQLEVRVVERSAELLIQQATPYLTDPQELSEYTPYLPGMAFFGMPRALLGDGGWAVRLLGDVRVWFAAAFLLSLRAGRTVLRPAPGGSSPGGHRAYRTAVVVLVASPPVALSLCVSGVDLPLTGLCCLALALVLRNRPVAAGLVLAAACSLKWTAWPAVAVAASALGGAYGMRAAVRLVATAVAGTLVLVLPSALLAPGPMVQQVLAFPTGRGEVATPAASPLPGRLLADTGQFGWYTAVALLVCGGAAVAVSLVLRPPGTLVATADRLAVGMSIAFLLAPAGRFGYLALPLTLVVWARLESGRHAEGTPVLRKAVERRRRDAEQPTRPVPASTTGADRSVDHPARAAGTPAAGMSAAVGTPAVGTQADDRRSGGSWDPGSARRVPRPAPNPAAARPAPAPAHRGAAPTRPPSTSSAAPGPRSHRPAEASRRKQPRSS
ncbi:glycosyltransferase 87 family protein [Streptomyces sp. NPDC057552]|uniref:glycosyltransferase 87 family protein n=1 Tax=Streptomyces sp. NPDC057552 TaxID=3350537 RepID=UPI0036B7C742